MICVYYKGARLSGNKMLHQYHPGAFGKDVPGQWSCCKRKMKGAIGCSDISQLEACPIDRTQSVICDQKPGIYNDLAGISASAPDMQKDISIPKVNYVRFEQVNDQLQMADTHSLKSQGNVHVQ